MIRSRENNDVLPVHANQNDATALQEPPAGEEGKLNVLCLHMHKKQCGSIIFSYKKYIVS